MTAAELVPPRVSSDSECVATALGTPEAGGWIRVVTESDAEVGSVDPMGD